jgi:translation initiation factor IF-2
MPTRDTRQNDYGRQSSNRQPNERPMRSLPFEMPTREAEPRGDHYVRQGSSNYNTQSQDRRRTETPDEVWTQVQDRMKSDEEKTSTGEEASGFSTNPNFSRSVGSTEQETRAPERREYERARKPRNTRYNNREDDFDAESFEERRSRRAAEKARKKREQEMAAAEAGPVPIFLPEYISIANLGDALGIKQNQFLRQLEDLGFEDINAESIMTGETAALVAQEYGFEPTVDSGEQVDLKPRPAPEDPSALPPRPPVVTIMGHVDHGKTTLLDYLRKSSVAASEHGGITQHIGAFSVKLSAGKQITFLDTPGHAAFLTMRQRGANVTDIVILVVAADDSVKPQTIEALKHARAAKVPIIVAINKVDKDSANVDLVKSDLAKNGVEIEDYGGDVQTVLVSGRTGQGMADLEESILSLSEILDLRAEPDGMAEGWVLEASVKPTGRAATVLVKRGTLRKGDYIVAGKVFAKIRLLLSEGGVEVDEAPPGTPVEIMGWKELPDAGDEVLQAPNEDKAKNAIEYRRELTDRGEAVAQMAQQDQDRRQRELEKAAAEENPEEEVEENEEGPKSTTVNFLVRGDVDGSVEAVCASIMEIGNNEVHPKILRSGPGLISESDVEYATISGSHIVNFNNPVPGHIKRMVEEAGVKIMDYNIIYHLVDAIKDTLSAHLKPTISTKVLGEAEVLQLFPINIRGRVYKNIAGCRIRNGLISRNAKFRVIRKGKNIFEGETALLAQLFALKTVTNWL